MCECVCDGVEARIVCEWRSHHEDDVREKGDVVVAMLQEHIVGNKYNKIREREREREFGSSVRLSKGFGSCCDGEGLAVRLATAVLAL